jgi:hypothetical protein
MTSTLSVPQLTTLETETRSPSPGATTKPSLNKPDFTASIGPDRSVEDASTLVDRALSGKGGEMIQVSPTTSGIPREMQEDLNMADKMFWNGKPVTREDFETMTETDPEYQWERQMLAGDNFREGLKGVGKGLLVIVSGVLVGRSAWRRYRPMRRDNTPGRSGSGGCLSECLSLSIPRVGLQLGMKNKGQSWSNLRVHPSETAWISSCRFVRPTEKLSYVSYEKKNCENLTFALRQNEQSGYNKALWA